MLALRNLSKTYETAGFIQKALDNVSVTFRDNEFVAVLGASGSGKTTLLNIVGGLDHYDDGDLVIDHVSTKDNKSKDWDTYRNNRVGFVFQSYNLIPHQTVIANVELALTLSGIGRAQRRDRAKKALTKVGLAEHMHKKPSQLSGGQMQRVAIARAIINDPEILLADEPTGALDSKTSVQIMELLKEIAQDRLVVMVTHNPELADDYANRIIKLSDGQVVGDTRPVASSELFVKTREVHRARMSLITALMLSFSNLMTKKGRTIMMSFAGSIGIIGIAGILALSNGVNNYIKNVEEDTLSVYPLTIQSTGFDMTSLLARSMGNGDDEKETSAEKSKQKNDKKDQVTEMPVISSIFDRVQSNDLKSLKSYIDSNQNGIKKYVNSIQYQYDVTPQIYLPDTSKEVHQVHPDRSFNALGMGTANAGTSMGIGMNTNMFSELIDDYKLYEEQYEVLKGRWPSGANEVVLVLGYQHHVADFMLYALGLKDYRDLNKMIEAFINQAPIETSKDRKTFSYEEIMDVTFKLVYNSDYYTKDENYHVWVDHSDDQSFLKGLVENGKTIKISGIVAAKADTSTLMLSPGIYYTSDMVKEIVIHADRAAVTTDQLANPELNIFTNHTFFEEADKKSQNQLDMKSLFSIDQEKMAEAFKMDTSVLDSINFNSVIDENALIQALPVLDVSSAIQNITPPTGMDQTLASLMQNAITNALPNLINGYIGWYGLQDPTTYPPADLANHFGEFLQTPEAQSILQAGMSQLSQDAAFIAYQRQMTEYQQAVQDSLSSYLSLYMQNAIYTVSSQIAYHMQLAMADLTENMTGAMSLDESVFMDAFKFNLSEEELTALVLSMVGGQESSLDSNLRKLGYANFDKPSKISIFPLDFEGKQHIIDALDSYNQKMEKDGKKEQVISYTDIVGILMRSVTEIINMISMVLVAFVAISLVVSSIMIGIITYISVLERKKEIGILRSIGASKRDIGNVFNAETLIVGLVAGAMGIGITLLLSIPVNIIIMNLYHIKNLVLLPPQAGLILIAVSCLLTFLAGLLPSSAASRKDPVEALRSE